MTTPFVLTVCDSAAGEACPVWPGHPSIARWAIDDPVAVEGSDADKEQAFIRAFDFLKSRIGTFIRLPSATLDQFGMATGFRPLAIWKQQAGLHQGELTCISGRL